MKRANHFDALNSLNMFRGQVTIELDYYSALALN